MSHMTITYPNGKVVNAVLLSRGKHTLRAAVMGEDDARAFTLADGTWISDGCEAVRIEFGWERRGKSNVPTDADCVIPEQFASRLISMLLAGSTGDDDVLEDMLWVFCAEGQRVRINQASQSSAPVVDGLSLASSDFTLLN